MWRITRITTDVRCMYLWFECVLLLDACDIYCNAIYIDLYYIIALSAASEHITQLLCSCGSNEICYILL